ncbi:Tat pathway signal sequence domain protein [Ancylostoma duodenale]|uniref:Tat pathway signal sequence domain protein n=1 Tax=Ancylostoma duodenale TaxID=51022 RepID=A0A0C2CBD2_9BILA|nr:Tat pathway signal sequence domain protein [Ancylostoma duodenale]
MTRITDTRAGIDGRIRDVELVTSTSRKIRRPVNSLVPLEIPGVNDTSQETTQDSEGSNPPQRARRYNLRPRPTTRDADPKIATDRSSSSTKITRRWFLFYIMIVSVLVAHASKATIDMQMTCTDKDVLIMSAIANRSFQICTDHSYEFHVAKSHPYLVQLPPRSTLHDHKVLLKRDTGGRIATMKTICRVLDFCDNLNCCLYAHVLFNPECWPTGAVFVTMFFLYAIMATSYLLLYVLMTIGKPIRLILQGIKVVLMFLFFCITKLCLILLRRVTKRHTPTRRDRLTVALAAIISFTILNSPNAFACQHVNAFEHHILYYVQRQGNLPNEAHTELLKISTFHQEACLRVTHNSSLIVNLKVRWKGLYLQCEQESLYFTRAAK